MKLRQCQIVIDKNKLNVDIQSVFNRYDTIKKCAYILHEQGDTPPHYHICLHFGGAAVDIQEVAKWFGLSYKDEYSDEYSDTRFIYQLYGCWDNTILYLSRGNDKPTILMR